MKNNSVKNDLIILMLILFIVSSVTPMIIADKVESTKTDEYLENLSFVFSYDNDYSRSEYYNKYLLKDSSNNNVVIEPDLEELTISEKSSLNPVSIVGPMDSAWPMQSHDTHHTGRSPYSTINTDTEILRFETDDWVESGIVIDNNDIIYFGDFDRYVYAIYPNGTLKWKYQTDGWIWSTPAVDENGTILVGSYDNGLYAFYPDGIKKWKFDSGGSISSSPAIADDGTIYFGTLWSLGDGGKIYAVNPDGTEKWRYQTGWHISSDPAIGDDGTVYIGSGDTYLYALWPNGTLRWRFKTGDEIHGHPSIDDDGTIYIGSWDDYFYAINPDGTEKWKFNSGWGTSNCAAIDVDGTIYVGTDKLYARNPDGSEKWTFNLGTDRHIGKSSPAISSDGIIYIGIEIGTASGGEIIAVNSDESERWRKKISNDYLASSPAIAEDGTIYIGSTYDAWKGYLHAFGIIENNEPPSAPVITGETNGNAGDSYTYTFVSNDPENYPLKYYIEWGDNTSTGWTKEYDSGEEAKISHTWSEQGMYEIRAKAMDISNYESEWSDPLSVTMPRNKVVNIPFLNFLENHPNMFPILKYLLEL